MARTTTGGRKSTRSASAGKGRKTAASKGTAKTRRQQAEEEQRAREVRRDIRLLVLFAVMIFLFISTLGFGGVAGSAVSSVLFGLFGATAYAFPFFVFFMVIFTISNLGKRTLPAKCIAFVVLFLAAGCIFELTSGALTPMTQYSAQELYHRCAAARGGGGLAAGTIAYFLYSVFKYAGAALILAVTIIICLLVISQHSVIAAVRRFRKERMESGEPSFMEKRKEEFEEAVLDARERREISREHRREMARKKAEIAHKKQELRMQKQQERLERKSRALSVNLEATSVRSAQELAEEEEFGASEDLSIYTSERAGRTAAPERRPVKAASAADRKASSDPAPVMEKEPVKKERTEPFFVLKADPEQERENDLSLSDLETEEAPYEDLTRVRDTGVTELTVFTAAEEKESEERPEFPFEKEGPRNTAERRVRTVYAPAVGLGSLHAADEEPAADSIADAGGVISARTASSEVPPVPAPEEAHEETDDAPAVKSTAPEAAPAPVSAPAPAARAVSRPEISEEDLSGIEVHRDRGEDKASVSGNKITRTREYVYPPYDLMNKGMREDDPDTDRILKENGYILQDTLRTFGVNVTITAISHGPSVTRYELVLETGVKVSKIVSLADNIKLSLGATEVRIEAPIPGKKAIGIEVPNKTTTLVTLRDILESREFTSAKSKLTFAAGKDISGKTVVADISKMPHLLIAGATGSGKSVCINTIILSLLYKAAPDEVKMIMIDPKVVELSIYNGIPHLMIPVVTDPKKAAAALNWATAEMDKRYRLFAQAGVRDLNGYNSAVKERIAEGTAGEEKVLPRLVIIVDELADLMMIAKNEVETTICRLLQLARAAGIHMIIATQRPSVDVITGLIKSNMPSRIAFATASQVDSRTILDMAGAEKLIGKGDMLFYPQSYPKPVRLQGAFVSDEEVEDIVAFVRQNNSGSSHDEDMINEITGAAAPVGVGESAGTKAGNRYDEHFEAAGRFVIEKDKASIGLLQRVFKIGFNRAARIMDQLCEAGVVSDESGTKARQVLMTEAEFENYLQNEN
ncbi:MAG: DNA translocase FtsK 4TM domain-containing protein [Lachnospiraceae bacterium]|nr:DNA translocase FtsK 4TM domain-containing protein [Lachnospiraceae bacterium]